MSKKIFSLLIVLGLIGISPAMAQPNHPNSKEHRALNMTKYFMGERTVDTLVIKILTQNMPQYFNDPNLPQFTVIGKNNNYYMSIGGYTKFTIGYDWNNPINNPYYFVVSNIPMYTSPGNRALLQYGIGTTNFNINFVAFPTTRYKLGTFIDVIFKGPNYNAMLHYAYIKWFGITAGYNYSLFTDALATPPTIDFQGPNSMPFYRNLVLDYEYAWAKYWSFGVGLEKPVVSLTPGNANEAALLTQKVPDIPLYIQFAWNERSSWVRISGLMRNMQYRDLVTNKSINSFGWGGKISGSVSFIPEFTVHYMGLYGQGISNYINDLNGINMDMLPKLQRPGRLDNVRTGGGYLCLQYNFIPQAFVSGTYSILRTSTNTGYYEPDQYKNGQYVAGNLFWNVNAQLMLGVEYLWGQHQEQSGKRSVDNRVHAMLQFNF